MGQYYRPCLIKNKEITVYDRRVEPDCEYVLAKLMEHSWWQNPTVNAVAKLLYKQKGSLFWCGDYAEEAIGGYIWNTEPEALPNPEDFKLDGKIIINHTKEKYVDCDEYYKNSIDKDGWCIHPLSLLTALGNGLGGGDYHDGYINFNKVGCFAGDCISIEDKEQLNKEEYKEFEKFDIVFKEE